MDWLVLLLVVLIVVGIFLFVYGWRKQLQLAVFFGVTFVIAPVLYLIGWNVIVPFVPPVAFVMSNYIKKSFDPT